MPLDPFCGMTVETSTPHRLEKDAETYYFCCQSCLERFARGETGGDHTFGSCGSPGQPAQLFSIGGGSCSDDCASSTLSQSLTSGPSSAETGVTYICPMCPQIESPTPAPCPKCGMALEPIFASPWSSRRVYICQEHKSVKSETAGKCPECGQSLEVSYELETPQEDQTELTDFVRRLLLAICFSLPLMLLSMGPMLGIRLPQLLQSHWWQLLLCLPVVCWSGWPLLIRAWTSVRTRQLNMFTLIGLGAVTAFLYSLIITLVVSFAPHMLGDIETGNVYFEAAAFIITLALLGQVLETRARHQTGSAIRQLLSLAPPQARRQTAEGWEVVPLDDVQVGDKLRVLPGDTVPVDGQLLEGESDVDESMLTGESLPVFKTKAAKVFGGTLNGSGSFLLEAGTVGREMTLAKIIRLVGDAQRSRAPIQSIADRVAGWFVPSVLAIALVTFIVWLIWSPLEPKAGMALVNAIAVLIIACPCALGLATPMSLVVGIGRAALNGILIRRAGALEALASTEILVLDKTGTLTEGSPQVSHVLAAGNSLENSRHADEAEILSQLAALEQQSEHPLARAIVAHAHKQKLELPKPESFHNHVGEGISGRIGKHDWVIGSRPFLENLGSRFESSTLARLAELEVQGSLVCAARDGEFVAALLINDPLKTNAKQTIAQLQQAGVRVVILSGDQQAAVAQVARHLGVREFHGRMTPSDKKSWIEAAQDQGSRVAMAGDGVNDAPALAQANVGIAMEGGTDVAIETADITLLRGDLQGVVKALQLSRLTIRNIRQNLAFAFGYNSLGIPIAAGIFYPLAGVLLSPIFAAVAMSLSSFSVIANALRISKQKLRAISKLENGALHQNSNLFSVVERNR